MDDLGDLSPWPTEAVKVVDDVEQVRALTEPLRMRILGELCGPPRTTKQVADRLDERPTRLYHHVEILEKAGLVRLVGTRPKRGTLEKYYQAVARQFRVESSLFTPGSGGEGPAASWAETGARVIEGAVADLRRLDPATTGAERAVIGRLRIRAAPAVLEEVRRRAEALLTEIQELGEGDDGSDGDTDTLDLSVLLFPAAE